MLSLLFFVLLTYYSVLKTNCKLLSFMLFFCFSRPRQPSSNHNHYCNLIKMYAQTLANIKLWSQNIEVESIEFFCRLEFFPMGDLRSKISLRVSDKGRHSCKQNLRWLYTQTQRTSQKKPKLKETSQEAKKNDNS